MALSLALLWATALFSGCGGAQAGAPTAPLTAERLFPLGDGYVWTFDVDTGVGPPALGISRVVSAEAPYFRVSNNGADALMYEVRDGGIYRPDRGLWLIKAPFEVGTRWPADGGRSAVITSADADVSTPAGDFRGCVVVDEGGGDEDREVRTTFCPDVGVVAVDTSIAARLSGQRVVVRARLRAYLLES